MPVRLKHFLVRVFARFSVTLVDDIVSTVAADTDLRVIPTYMPHRP